MSAPREVELKLECGGPDLAALAAHPLLQDAEGARDLIATTYFDTPDEALREAGLTLRVRRRNERFVQTVKTGEGGAGLFDRAEWEMPVAGETPDLALLAETPVPEVLGKAGAADLVPRFATVVMRSERSVGYGAARILATLDEGRVESAAGDSPLCELELELAEGSPGDLFALAQALAETVPLRIGVRAKSARGFALLDGKGLRPSKAEPVAMPEDASVGEAFRLIALACLRQLRLNEEVFLAHRPPEALHQIRVSIRRLRSAFSLFKPVLEGDPRAAALSEEIKRVTEPFGPARNLDVFLATTLPAEMERRPDEPGLTALRARLEAEHARVYARVFSVLEAPEWRVLLLDLLAWIETGAWRALPAANAPAQDFAAETLDRFRRRVKKRGRHLDHLDPEERHRVRIAAKKLRYGAEFFAALYSGKKAGKRHKTFVSALSDLQDHLGALNDLATAHHVMASLADPEGAPADGQTAFAAGLTAADNEAQADALLAKAAEAHADLVDVKPFWR